MITPPVAASPIERAAAGAVRRWPPRAPGSSGRCCSRCPARPGTRRRTAGATESAPANPKHVLEDQRAQAERGAERQHHGADQDQRRDQGPQQQRQDQEHHEQHDRDDQPVVRGRGRRCPGRSRCCHRPGRRRPARRAAPSADPVDGVLGRLAVRRRRRACACDAAPAAPVDRLARRRRCRRRRRTRSARRPPCPALVITTTGCPVPAGKCRASTLAPSTESGVS